MNCFLGVPSFGTRFVLEAASAVLGCYLPGWIYSMLREHTEFQVGPPLLPQKVGLLLQWALCSLNQIMEDKLPKGSLEGGTPTGARARVKKYRISEGFGLGTIMSLPNGIAKECHL